MADHITKYSVINVILFLLVYDRKSILPINAAKSLIIYEHIMNIVKEIPHIREEIKLMIQKV